MKVLYATDGSQSAFDAKSVLIKLFRRDGLRVSAATVTHSGSLDPGHVILELDPIAERRGDSHEIVAAAATELDAAGFTTSTVVLEGSPGRELVRMAGDRYSLVVLGAGSHSWLGNRLLGSVSTYVLHEAPCSVLLVHEATTGDVPGRVVVGVDGSNTSEETVRMLARVLDPKRCEVEVLSVVQYRVPAPAPALVGPALGAVDPEIASRVDADLVERSDGYVDAAAGTFRDAGFRTTTRVEHGGAATVLLDEARRSKSDLVAVGSRGLGPIRRAFLGSVSDQVARLAPATLVGRFWINEEDDQGDPSK